MEPEILEVKTLQSLCAQDHSLKRIFSPEYAIEVIYVRRCWVTKEAILKRSFAVGFGFAFDFVLLVEHSVCE